MAAVEVAGVAVAADRVLDGARRAGRVRDLAAVLFGAEAAGSPAGASTTAAEYAKVREQFGRPIGQFQGVKHKLRRMLIALEQARAAVWDAARASDERRRPRRGGFAAGGRRRDRARRRRAVARDAIQMLGGIGFTWEHDAHLYLRRALTLRSLLGPASDWAAEVAAIALDGGRRAVVLELDDDTEPLRERIRAEIAELAAIEDKEELHARLGDEGWIVPALPEAVGTRGRPRGADPHPAGAAGRARSRPRTSASAPGWCRRSSGTARRRAEGALPAADAARGDRVVPAVLRAGRRVRPRVAAMKAERVEGGWRLTGQKIWTSLAHHAQWGFCIARTDPERAKHEASPTSWST